MVLAEEQRRLGTYVALPLMLVGLDAVLVVAAAAKKFLKYLQTMPQPFSLFPAAQLF
jgi:hypothetical protein